MSEYSGLARGDLVRHRGGFAFTKKGEEALAELVECGSSMEDIADYFCVSVEWIKKVLGPGGSEEELFRHCSAKFKRAVRRAQVKLADENASMARFLGSNLLGQSNNPAPQDPDLENRVVGAMPDWSGSPDDWATKHKPQKDGGSTIDKLKAMRPKAIAPVPGPAPAETEPASEGDDQQE